METRKINKEDFKVGDFVLYDDEYTQAFGRIKTITEHGIFVVYHCNRNWDNYQNYTAANSPIEYLYKVNIENHKTLK